VIARVLTLGRLGAVQLLRGRVYLNLLVAGIALVAAALMFDRLSAGDGGRVFVDVGLAFSALIVAALVATIGIGLVTRDIETRQVHLLLARPMGRGELVLGRFVTLALLALVSQLILGLVMAGVALVIEGADPMRLLGASLFATLEGWIVAALIMVFGTTSSSTVSALFVTTVFALGRLTPTLQELIDKRKFGPGAHELLQAVHAALPHLDRFDLTLWARTGRPPAVADLALSVLYALLYCAGLLAIASFRFGRRDVL
jgi:ABC-type transport system involved in multi-copper enzyme maturation permease subunit